MTQRSTKADALTGSGTQCPCSVSMDLNAATAASISAVEKNAREAESKVGDNGAAVNDCGAADDGGAAADD
jgi:hypothetical protein